MSKDAKCHDCGAGIDTPPESLAGLWDWCDKCSKLREECALKRVRMDQDKLPENEHRRMYNHTDDASLYAMRCPAPDKINLINRIMSFVKFWNKQ